MFLLCRWGNWNWYKLNNFLKFTEPEITGKTGIKALFFLIPKTLLFPLDHLHLESIFSSMGCEKVYRITIQSISSSQSPCLSLGMIDNKLSRIALSLSFVLHASPVGLLASATGSFLETYSLRIVLFGDDEVFREISTWSKDLLFVSLPSLSSFVKNTVNHDSSHRWISSGFLLDRNL